MIVQNTSQDGITANITFTVPNSEIHNTKKLLEENKNLIDFKSIESDTNISKLELAEAIKKQINDLVIEENSIEKDPDQRNYIVSNEKIESCGFKTKYSLDDGIKEIIKFYPILKSQNYRNI